MKQVPILRKLTMLLLLATAACAPRFHPGGEPITKPGITSTVFQTSDGIALPLHVWPATSQKPMAIIIALHGFNDYARAFEMPASWWSKNGITVYAYDQRGFGAAPHTGLWSSSDTMARDLAEAIQAIHNLHPKTPVFALGASMGGAVVLNAMSDKYIYSRNLIDGVILVGPAVRGPSTLNPLYRLMLWLAAHIMPANHLTGEGLRVKASDNIPMLRALGRDPLIIKSTRIDTIYGLVQLMGDALESSKYLDRPALVLAAGDDQLIPAHAHQELLETLSTARVEAVYPDGFHMLLRDLQAEVVWRDILAWIRNKNAPLPSGFGHKKNAAKETVR